jgi:hypothetical protein
MNPSNWIERSEFAAAARMENRARIVSLTIRNGTGETCAYCQKPISPEAVEHEVQATVMATHRVLHFHRVCQHLWEDVV